MSIVLDLATSWTRYNSLAELFIGWSEGPNLHDGTATATAHNYAAIVPETGSPDRLARTCHFTHKLPCLHVELSSKFKYSASDFRSRLWLTDRSKSSTATHHLDTAVAPTTNNVSFVKLQTIHAVIVCIQAVDRLQRRRIVHNNPTIGPSSDEDIAMQLDLSNKGGMSVEKSNTIAKGKVEFSSQAVSRQPIARTQL